jgi:hypothetical protein
MPPAIIGAVTASYLYTDGTLIVVRSEGRGEGAEVFYGYCRVRIRRKGLAGGVTPGRIVVHPWSNEGFIALARRGSVEAVLPCIENGSVSTRRLGIVVQCLRLETEKGLKLAWGEFPALLNPVFVIEVGEAVSSSLEAGDYWGSAVVRRVVCVSGPIAV